VIGIPDADGGEMPRAYVTLKHGASATSDELKQFVAGNFDEFYTPVCSTVSLLYLIRRCVSVVTDVEL